MSWVQRISEKLHNKTNNVQSQCNDVGGGWGRCGCVERGDDGEERIVTADEGNSSATWKENVKRIIYSWKIKIKDPFTTMEPSVCCRQKGKCNIMSHCNQGTQ